MNGLTGRYTLNSPFQFKDLMNKIDPDDAEEDEDGAPLPGNESLTPQKRSLAVA
jgi:hypothetical protein